MSKYNISVDDIITTNAKQFISHDEKKLLSQLASQINGKTTQHPMYTEVYDRDNDNIVDVAQKALRADSVLWVNILDKPDFSIAEFEESVNNTHKHSNKRILDNIELDKNFNLVYNGIPIKMPDGLMYINDYDLDNDGMIDRAFYAESTTWENILNKPLYYMPDKHTHNGSDIYGDINASTLNGFTSESFMKKDDRVDISRIDNLDKLSFNVSEVHGGNSTSIYDGSTDETLITIRGDTYENLTEKNPILNKLEQCYETDFNRYKIGDGYTPWNGLPFIYNIPEAARFNFISKGFRSYYNYEENDDASVIKIDTNILNEYNDQLYSGAVKSINNKIIGIPYNTNNVLCYDIANNSISTFGESTIDGVYVNGSMWYGGVAYEDHVYCAPYNTNNILSIDVKNQSCKLIPLTFSIKNNAWTNGILHNGIIYFAPCNMDSILAFNPVTETVKLYQNSTLFNMYDNCCAIVNNPVNNLLYLIPKSNNKIIEFNPFTEDMKVVNTILDLNVTKFNTALLGTNGLIYCIPSYGYNYIMIFDPNTYIVQYVDIQLDMLESYMDAIMAPNNKIYMIPSGIGVDENGKVIEFDINTNTYKVIFIDIDKYNRWCGGILTDTGSIICLPYTNTELLRIDIPINGTMLSEYMSYFNN